MIKRAFRTCVPAFTLALLVTAAAAAQTPEPEAGVLFQRNVDIRIDGAAPGGFGFVTAPVAFEGETVAGAPYSAEAVTDVVQPLADGNRIVRQSRVQLARDGAGRTRREQGLSMLGPMVNDPSEMRQVQITDPGTHTIILLDLNRRTAHRMPAPNVRVTTNAAGGSTVTKERLRSASEPEVGTFDTFLPAPPPGALGGANMFYTAGVTIAMPPPLVQALGTQVMDGVEVEGTRTTFTIPAGQIGNERPVEIVSERWFSPLLKVLVMSRQADPRFGETTYRLTNISRAEPPPALFEVPPDFTVEADNPERNVIIRRTVK